MLVLPPNNPPPHRIATVNKNSGLCRATLKRTERLMKGKVNNFDSCPWRNGDVETVGDVGVPKFLVCDQL